MQCEFERMRTIFPPISRYDFISQDSESTFLSPTNLLVIAFHVIFPGCNHDFLLGLQKTHLFLGLEIFWALKLLQSLHLKNSKKKNSNPFSV